jgi:hypothetical protein
VPSRGLVGSRQGCRANDTGHLTHAALQLQTLYPVSSSNITACSCLCPPLASQRTPHTQVAEFMADGMACTCFIYAQLLAVLACAAPGDRVVQVVEFMVPLSSRGDLLPLNHHTHR